MRLWSHHSKALQENTILEKANNRQQTQQVKTNLSDKNIARQMGFDTGLSSGDQQENAAETRLRYVERVSSKFNEDLQSQIDGTLPAGYVYQLGTPSDILLSAGIANVPIQLNSTRLRDKSINYGHNFDLSDIKGLVKAINNPIAIFKYGNGNKAQNIVVEIQKGDKNFIVGLFITPTGRMLAHPLNPVGKMNKFLSSLEKKHNNYVTSGDIK